MVQWLNLEGMEERLFSWDGLDGSPSMEAFSTPPAVVMRTSSDPVARPLPGGSRCGENAGRTDVGGEVGEIIACAGLLGRRAVGLQPASALGSGGIIMPDLGPLEAQYSSIIARRPTTRSRMLRERREGGRKGMTAAQ